MALLLQNPQDSQDSMPPDHKRWFRRRSGIQEVSERTLVSPLALKRPAGRLIYWTVFALFLVSTLITFGPLYWMFSGALKSSIEIFQTPPTFWPLHPVWSNYLNAWNVLQIPLYFGNSLILSAGAVVLQILVSATAAYALSKLRPAGKNIIQFCFFCTLMVPPVVYLIPQFVNISDLPLLHVSLINSWAGVWLPEAASALNILILKSFFDTIPTELTDAARLDGANALQLFTRIILPLSRPALAVITIFTVIASWKDFLWPLLVLTDSHLQPLILAIYHASRICLRANSATVEVTVLAPGVFRVGLFPADRPACYSSEATVSREWEPGAVTTREGDSEVTMTTSMATAHISLDPLRIGFTDHTGRTFATDDPELGMGWFTLPEQAPLLAIVNSLAALGTPVRVYKKHEVKERYFGCGERTGELDKTGSHQLFWNIDPPRGHTALQNNLYVSIPFTLVIADGQAWGFFLDSTTRVEFNLAHEDSQRSWFEASNGGLVYYVFCGPTPQDVLAQYTSLTGHTPLPPRWALGYGQSRFSYETAEEMRQIARTFRERDIPCDTLYLDIDCLDGHRVFTWDTARFPDPEGLVSELREMGFHVVGIVDAGVKVDENYQVYAEGRKRDLYCKTPQGDDYQNAVWPGLCVFPDFTSPDTRAWWGEQHRPLLDVGIAGIWSDMNEPALFIPPNSTMPPDVIHPGGGKASLHLQVHNAYGSLMVQAAREGLLRLQPERRPFIISRAGYAGVQRHALLWTGDNSSTWEHLAMSLAQLQNLGLSGVGWAGVDIGGFYGDCSGELLARWTEFGIFQAFCRNHSEKQTRHQEPWVFGEPYESVCRAMLKLRQRLPPYLYTLFEECHRTGAPLLRPLFWSYPADPTAYSASDEFLCGGALLIAPITRPAVEYRHVYIPADTRFHFWTGERVDGPAHILAHAPPGQPAIYVRANTAVPLARTMAYVDQNDTDELTFALYPAEGSGKATLYEDAGDGYEHINGVYARRTITCEVKERHMRLVLGEQEGTFAPRRQRMRLELREIACEPEAIQPGETCTTWSYEPERRCLIFELHEAACSQQIDLPIR